MKIAVSLPDNLFNLAEAAAQRLDVSRSELYARALAEYLERIDADDVTRRLNEVYAAEDSQLDPAFHEAQLRPIAKDSW